MPASRRMRRIGGAGSIAPLFNYSTGFYEYTLNQFPSGWTKQWVTTGFDPKIFESGEYSGDRYLGVVSTSAVRNLATWDTPSAVGNADVEILVLWKLITTSSSINYNRLRFVLRGAGGAGNESAYMLAIRDNTGSGGGYRIAKYVSGGAFTMFGDTATHNFGTTNRYWTRFRVNGNTLKARTWQDGDAEPGSWGIETTDNDISAAGFCGFGCAGSSLTSAVYKVAIAFNGETAVVV